MCNREQQRTKSASLRRPDEAPRPSDGTRPRETGPSQELPGPVCLQGPRAGFPGGKSPSGPLCYAIEHSRWVPEGSLAGCFRCLFEVWPGPGGPGKALQNVGGEAPHLFGRVSRAPGARPNLKNATNKIRPDCLQVPRAAKNRPASKDLMRS